MLDVLLAHHARTPASSTLKTTSAAKAHPPQAQEQAQANGHHHPGAANGGSEGDAEAAAAAAGGPGAAQAGLGGLERKVLHVQSISSWAPSCIGPYSQVSRAPPREQAAGVLLQVYIFP